MTPEQLEARVKDTLKTLDQYYSWTCAADLDEAIKVVRAQAAEITRLTAAREEAEKRGYDAAKEQAHREAVRQGDVYRNNAKGASGLSASTLDEYRFAAAACDYVASAIRAMVKR